MLRIAPQDEEAVRFHQPATRSNREDMDDAAERHFRRSIPAKARLAARKDANVRGRVGRPRKSGGDDGTRRRQDRFDAVKDANNARREIFRCARRRRPNACSQQK
jgi:hypothetical protein